MKMIQRIEKNSWCNFLYNCLKNYLQQEQPQEEINVQEVRLEEKPEETKTEPITEEKPNKTEELVVEDESAKPVDSADKEQTEENIPKPTDKTSESQTVSGSSPVQESVDSSEETQAKEKQTKEQKEELEATINLISQQELSEAKKSAIKIIQKILEENKINFADLAIEKTKDWQTHLNSFATSQAVAQFVRQVQEQAMITNQTQINQTENNKSAPKPNYGLITGIIIGSLVISLTVYLVLRQVRRDKK